MAIAVKLPFKLFTFIPMICVALRFKEASLGSGQWLMQRHYVTGQSAEYRDFQVLSCGWNITSSPYHPRPRELCGEAVERMKALADKGRAVTWPLWTQHGWHTRQLTVPVVAYTTSGKSRCLAWMEKGISVQGSYWKWMAAGGGRLTLL